MLSNCFRVGIFIPTHSLSEDEINHLILQEEVINLALQRLLAMEISFQDYLEIAELCGVDVDDYLETVDSNCALVM